MSESRTILVVDDDPGTCQLIARMLKRYFLCSVTTVASATQARERVRDKQFDLAILDYQLEEGSFGTELYNELQSESRISSAILVTGYLDEQIRNLALRLGFTGFVLKGDNFFERLEHTISSLGLVRIV